MQIHKATLGEKETIIPMVLQMAQPSVDRLPRLAQRKATQYLSETLKKASDIWSVYVAVDGTKIIGTIWSMIGVNWRHPKRFGLMANLYVLPEYRRKGVGKALVKAIETNMKNEGISDIEIEVDAENQEAVKFYSSLGYKTIQVKVGKSI